MSICLETLLREHDGVHDYKINTVKTESYELFFVHNKLETVRATDTTATTVTVYVSHDGKLGLASFKVYASTQEGEAREKIAAAVKKAGMIANEPYALPENETLTGKIPSNLENESPEQVAAHIADAVFSADMLDFGSVNALEIFVNRLTVSVKNSRGIDKTETKYSAMIEAIPTWNEGVSVELYEAKRISRFDENEIRREIEEKMREVRDRGRAQPPAQKLTCPVRLNTEELSELFSELVSGLHYQSVYSHSNPHSIGDAVQKDPTGDRITVTMRGAIEGSVASALFDTDGVTLTDTEVISDGTVTAYFGDNRFAQYLGMPVTGNLSCMEVKAGTLTDKDLKTTPYFECVSMSGLQLDVYNDYIGGEVRLAYYHDGDTVIPVTGVSLSGKLSDALASLRLSQETACAGRYAGPAYGLFRGVEIV